MASTRLAAKQLGQSVYYTGKPCKREHTTYRYVGSGICAQCSAEAHSRVWAAGGNRPDRERRVAVNTKWNASEKAKTAKDRWRERDPKRAWAVYATGGAKSRAQLRGLPFDLTSAHVLSITPDTCPVFGTPFSFIGNKVVSANSASLDRIDPAKGYVQGNVAVISAKANAIKNAYDAVDIRKVADWLEENS